MIKENKKKTAFTLAEVLITLSIIGIVAAMTLPSLTDKYQKIQTTNQLKKAYSEINQAILLAQKEYGTIDSWDLIDFTNAQERLSFFGEKYLFPHIKTLKKCYPISSECWADETYTLDNKIFSVEHTGRGAFLTTSGYSVVYWLHSSGNGGWFWIDINGPEKRPNTAGKDIFPFIMSWGNAGSVPQTDSKDCTKRLGFYPRGLECNNSSPTRVELIEGTYKANTSASAYKCKKGSGASIAGGYCGALLMQDGWVMKDDYPW